MRAKDWIFVAGTALLAVGPELQTDAPTKAEWQTGRGARILGVFLMGVSRGIQSRPSLLRNRPVARPDP